MKIRINRPLFLYLGITVTLFLYGLYLLPKTPIHLPTFPLTPTTTSAKLSEIKKVVRVIDGDTVVIDGNVRVRYLGMDTPETVDPKKPVECYGPEASDKNKELVEGKTIRMEKDVSETDTYGRLLRYVWVENNSATGSSELFINDFLVRQGFAKVDTFPPDIAYSKQFTEAQKEAQMNNRGLWDTCK